MISPFVTFTDYDDFQFTAHYSDVIRIEERVSGGVWLVSTSGLDRRLSGSYAANQAILDAVWTEYVTGLGGAVPRLYTPTLSGVANVAASTAYECQYVQIGNMVLVSGKLDIDPTLTATSTELGISLPVASDFATAQQCGGVAFAPGIASQGAAILADTTNNRAQLQYISTDVTNQAMYFIFAYQVV